jgi:DNA-binding transcriptional MerR regulator
MMSLAEIQHAIEELPQEQRAALVAWFAARDRAEREAALAELTADAQENDMGYGR